MTFYLLQHEGLFVGPSAGLNVAGAVKLARELGWLYRLHPLGRLPAD